MGLFRWLARLVKRPLFIVHLHDGHAIAEKGNLSVGFLTECADLAGKRGIAEGRLFGVWRSGVVSLEFTRGIPEEHHQAFRNLWGLYRGRHKR